MILICSLVIPSVFTTYATPSGDVAGNSGKCEVKFTFRTLVDASLDAAEMTVISVYNILLIYYQYIKKTSHTSSISSSPSSPSSAMNFSRSQSSSKDKSSSDKGKTLSAHELGEGARNSARSTSSNTLIIDL